MEALTYLLLPLELMASVSWSSVIGSLLLSSKMNSLSTKAFSFFLGTTTMPFSSSGRANSSTTIRLMTGASAICPPILSSTYSSISTACSSVHTLTTASLKCQSSFSKSTSPKMLFLTRYPWLHLPSMAEPRFLVYPPRHVKSFFIHFPKRPTTQSGCIMSCSSAMMSLMHSLSSQIKSSFTFSSR